MSPHETCARGEKLSPRAAADYANDPSPGVRGRHTLPTSLWRARNGRLSQPEKKGRSPNLRKKGFVSGSPHPEGWARHSTTLKRGVSQRSPARGGCQWQVPLPESVAVWPATGMNCHAYVPSPRVSLSTPYTLQFPRGGTFAVVDH